MVAQGICPLKYLVTASQKVTPLNTEIQDT